MVILYGNSVILRDFPYHCTGALTGLVSSKKDLFHFALRRRYCKESQACIKEFDHFCGCAWLPTMPYPPRTAGSGCVDQKGREDMFCWSEELRILIVY